MSTPFLQKCEKGVQCLRIKIAQQQRHSTETHKVTEKTMGHVSDNTQWT